MAQLATNPLLVRSSDKLGIMYKTDKLEDLTSIFSQKWALAGGLNFRVAVMILGAINLVVALLMIASILHDAWPAKETKASTQFKKSFNSRLTLHPAEVFPVVVSLAIVVQGTIFITIQSGMLQEIVVVTCRATAQIIWPVIWIVPYTILVFGLETTFRSLQRSRFHSRGTWNVPLCVIGMIALTLVTWVTSNFTPTKGQCVASLLWPTLLYAKPGVVIACALISTYALCATVITIQLLRKVKTDRDERIAATRVTYYLVASIVVLALVLPFFIATTMRRGVVRTSQIAEIAVNLFGFISGVLHVFLRSNADRSAIRAIETPWSDKRRLRIFGPSDLDMKMHISSPILFQTSENKMISDEDDFVAKSEQSRGPSPNRSPIESNASSTRLQHLDFAVPQTSSLTQPVRAVSSYQTSQNRSNYSVFPSAISALAKRRSSIDKTISQGKEYQPSPLVSRSRERGFSELSSATVQIGLRFSYLNRALDSIDKAPTSPVLYLPFQITSNSPISSMGSKTVFTRPVLRSSISSSAINEIVALPIQPGKAQIVDQTRMPTPDWILHSRPVHSKTTPGSPTDRGLIGIAKPLPPAPPGLDSSNLQVRAFHNNSWIEPRHEPVEPRNWV